MSVSNRFIKLAVIGMILVMLLSIVDLGGISLILLNIILIGLLLYDKVMLPKKDKIVITAVTENKLYYKAENIIEFSVLNNSHVDLTVELKDSVPDIHFIYRNNNMKNIVLSGEKAVFSYVLNPNKRGNFKFNNIYVRYNTNFGMYKKYFVFPLFREIKIYPNLQNLSKYRLAIQKSNKLEIGEKRIRLIGTGTEFESLREYVKGDDYRKINWKATSRAQKPIINIYEAEKNQPVFIMIDSGRPLSFTLKGNKKLDYAINAALILSDIVNSKGDKTGLISFNTEVNCYIPPNKGVEHRNKLMEALYTVNDTNYTSNYDDAFMEVIKRQKRRSLVFIFTDFEMEEEAQEIIKNIYVLKKRHIPIILLMKNDSLIKMANSEETSHSKAYEKAMAVELLEHRKKIIRKINSLGVFCAETDSENLAMDSINAYLKIKAKNIL